MLSPSYRPVFITDISMACRMNDLIPAYQPARAHQQYEVRTYRLSGSDLIGVVGSETCTPFLDVLLAQENAALQHEQLEQDAPSIRVTLCAPENWREERPGTSVPVTSERLHLAPSFDIPSSAHFLRSRHRRPTADTSCECNVVQWV